MYVQTLQHGILHAHLHARTHKLKARPVAAVYTVTPTQQGRDACALSRHPALSCVPFPPFFACARTILSRPIRPFTRQLVPSLFEESISRS